MTDQQMICARIMEFQQSTGLSVMSFVKKAGIVRSNYYRAIQRGKPSITVLIAISKAFPRCDMNFIFYGHQDKKKTS